MEFKFKGGVSVIKVMRGLRGQEPESEVGTESEFRGAALWDEPK